MFIFDKYFSKRAKALLDDYEARSTRKSGVLPYHTSVTDFRLFLTRPHQGISNLAGCPEVLLRHDFPRRTCYPFLLSFAAAVVSKRPAHNTWNGVPSEVVRTRRFESLEVEV